MKQIHAKVRFSEKGGSSMKTPIKRGQVEAFGRRDGVGRARMHALDSSGSKTVLTITVP